MKHLVSLLAVFILYSPNIASACQAIGSPETRWRGYTESIIRVAVKTNQTCVDAWNLKQNSGRLNYRLIEIMNLESDGTVITKLEKLGESDYKIIYKPTIPGEHWISYKIRQYPHNEPAFDVKYIFELKVDIAYKDPGILD